MSVSGKIGLSGLPRGELEALAERLLPAQSEPSMPAPRWNINQAAALRRNEGESIRAEIAAENLKHALSSRDREREFGAARALFRAFGLRRCTDFDGRAP